MPAPDLVSVPAPVWMAAATVVSPLPPTVRLKPEPVTVEPLTVRRLPLLLFQVWLAAKATLLLMPTVPLPERMLIPVPLLAFRVSVLPLIDTGLVALVPLPVKVRLLMVKSSPRVVVRVPAATLAVKNTSAPAPGVALVSVDPVAAVTQLVAPALLKFQLPLVVPFQ